MFLSVWLHLLSFMFNPWALLFFVVLFCVLFVLIEFVLSWSLKSFQYLLRLLVLVFFLFVSQAPDFRECSSWTDFASFCFLLLLFFLFSIVSRFRGINGKKLTFKRLQFCPTFQSLFWTNLRPKFFLFAVSLFILLAARLLRACLHQNCTC